MGEDRPDPEEDAVKDSRTLLDRLMFWRHPAPPPPPVYVGSHLDKLMRLKPIAHDPDERQCREDIESARPRGLGRLAG